ncbi:hypothetical protein DMH12_07015 [Streptomyces sp. WAC 04229]|uniref:hypothetical protein n=1 Tax=Streptomyces sp. WAC 04229 TaxID=2203206 RepID=UPI000F7483A8|nr:hypothetical protein [Streptomyces sp. WAC 04229]RSN61880.1 hypothetical protein DMH12_07015 [Streptomyces sp. WAC 04229]
MRRTARALSVAVLASAALGALAGPSAADPAVPPPPAGAGEPVPPPADGEPVPPPAAEEPVLPPAAEEPLAPAGGRAAAEVSPADVTPGGTVTVSVSCAPTGGSAPATLDATSLAFDEGTVELRKVEGEGGTGAGPAYRGTARIAAAEDFGSEADAEGAEEDWTVDGSCPDEAGGEGDPWSATMNVPGATAGESGTAKPACPPSTAPHGDKPAHGTPCATEPPCPGTAAPHGESAEAGRSCGGGKAEHGVRAGAGGTFSDSVPALAAGGVLIAGACAAAAHRLRLRLRGEDGER